MGVIFLNLLLPIYPSFPPFFPFVHTRPSVLPFVRLPDRYFTFARRLFIEHVIKMGAPAQKDFDRAVVARDTLRATLQVRRGVERRNLVVAIGVYTETACTLI
jgi:hypothetical protein